MNYTIRELQKQEYSLLDNFLYEAIFIPEDIESPPKTITASPELQVYVEHFGELKDNKGLAAEIDGKIIGAAWVQIGRFSRMNIQVENQVACYEHSVNEKENDRENNNYL